MTSSFWYQRKKVMQILLTHSPCKWKVNRKLVHSMPFRDAYSEKTPVTLSLYSICKTFPQITRIHGKNGWSNMIFCSGPTWVHQFDQSHQNIRPRYCALCFGSSQLKTILEWHSVVLLAVPIEMSMQWFIGFVVCFKVT